MKVLLLDRWTDAARAKLAECCEICEKDDREAEGVIIPLGPWPPIFTQAIANLPGLRFIASCTTGLDHIDTDYARSKGVEIISLQGDPFLQDVWATAEHTWALILAIARRIPWAHADTVGGHWDREAWQGTELRGKTLGIVGYGRVGRQVEQLAQAFGMLAPASECWSDSRFILPECDVITVHVPLTESTRAMCDADFFDRCKPGALFVNTSRGAVVNEHSLLRALKTGQIAAAALDVACGEPDINPALREYARTHDNLLLTPHLGGNTRESREKTQCHIADKIRRFIEERAATCTSAR